MTTDTQHLTILKHLAAGKTLDVVAAITKLDRSAVLEVASKHGYPDTEKIAWAADILERKALETEVAEQIPSKRAVTPGRPLAAVPQAPAVAASTPATAGHQRPDDIRVLINAAKSHPSKRIQAAGDRLVDQVDKLRALIAEDDEKHAARRAAAAEKAAARAEVDRLEHQLHEARAKLRGDKATATPSASDAAQVRAWAADNGVQCPTRGRVPQHVRDAYDRRDDTAAAG